MMMCLSVLCGCTNIKTNAWVKPILISTEDSLTEGTAKQILIHNETWEETNK